MAAPTAPAAKPGFDLPDTPAGRQMAWFLAHSLTKGRDLTTDEVLAHMVFPSPWTPDESLARFAEGDDRPARLGRVRGDDPYAIDVVQDYGDDRPMNIAMSV